MPETTISTPPPEPVETRRCVWWRGGHRWVQVSHVGVIATDRCKRCGAEREEVVYG